MLAPPKKSDRASSMTFAAHSSRPALATMPMAILSRRAPAAIDQHHPTRLLRLHILHLSRWSLDERPMPETFL
jgi:hypothetical protein